MPPNTLQVDDISSEAECQALGARLVARSKNWNSANRYTFECFAVEKATR